ncbi:sugar transferase [Acuticoccus sp.]|uniref:sugar transferase n=1 Tax=Acuticoccus sp. TaxID=1904378 RepID=UPI003B527119
MELLDGCDAGGDVAYRVRDIVVATLMLVFALPILVVAMLAIKAETGGPCFFFQQRGGRFRRPFQCIKLRTMVVMENGGEVQQATRRDARVTRVGALLRRTCIDELPQLINVLRGEMSLVGPRPHAVLHDQQFAQLCPDYDLRFAVKPGMTGLAQTMGFRGEVSSVNNIARRTALDLEYVARRSLALDVKLMLLTPLRLVVRPTATEARPARLERVPATSSVARAEREALA